MNFGLMWWEKEQEFGLNTTFWGLSKRIQGWSLSAVGLDRPSTKDYLQKAVPKS